MVFINFMNYFTVDGGNFSPPRRRELRLHLALLSLLVLGLASSFWVLTVKHFQSTAHLSEQASQATSLVTQINWGTGTETTTPEQLGQLLSEIGALEIESNRHTTESFPELSYALLELRAKVEALLATPPSADEFASQQRQLQTLGASLQNSIANTQATASIKGTGKATSFLGLAMAFPILALLLTRDLGGRMELSSEYLSFLSASASMTRTGVPSIVWTTNDRMDFSSLGGSGLSKLEINPKDVIGEMVPESRDVDSTIPSLADRQDYLDVMKGGRIQRTTSWKDRLFSVTIEPYYGRDGALVGTMGIAVDLGAVAEQASQKFEPGPDREAEGPIGFGDVFRTGVESPVSAFISGARHLVGEYRTEVPEDDRRNHVQAALSAGENFLTSLRGLDSPEDADQKNGKRILIAEDNVNVRTMLSSYLTKRGYEVTQVADGKDAVTEALTSSYDLIFMDIDMPAMDGLSATKMIRQNMDTEVPIIALTGMAADGDREKCVRAGCDGYLAKPYRFDDLDTYLAPKIAS